MLYLTDRETGEAMMRRYRILTLALVLVVIAPAHAMAQTPEERIVELEGQVATLQAEVASLDAALGDAAALEGKLQGRIDALVEQNRARGWVMVKALRGQVKALRARLRRTNPRFQTQAQRWATISSLHAWFEQGCVDGTEYSVSYSSTGSSQGYSFYDWGYCSS